MNLSALPRPMRYLIGAAAAFVAILLASWVAGQCRTYRQPKPTPVQIDAGVPTPGPSSAAPTIKEDLIVARPDLTREEVEAYAKKYGYVLTKPAKNQGRKLNSQPANSSPVSLTANAPPAVEQAPRTWPMHLAEETFVHHPSGVAVDVEASLPGYGQRVDLRASWRNWAPPPAPKGGPSYCLTDRSFFSNEAKWTGYVGAGVVASEQGVGLGPVADLGYKGPRTGRVTWGAGGHGAYSGQSGFTGDAAFRLSF